MTRVPPVREQGRVAQAALPASVDVILPANVLRQLAAAPHRLLFFVGVTNVLLAMAWWAAWLVDARWSASCSPWILRSAWIYVRPRADGAQG